MIRIASELAPCKKVAWKHNSCQSEEKAFVCKPSRFCKPCPDGIR